MKRTPLKRKTPLKRTGRLRPVSKKRAALKQLMDPKRVAFVLSAECCMVCRQNHAIDCHEICRGHAREAALSRPELWLAVCRGCHDLLDDTAAWPHDKQIAIAIGWEIRKRVRSANEVLARNLADPIGVLTELNKLAEIEGVW